MNNQDDHFHRVKNDIDGFNSHHNSAQKDRNQDQPLVLESYPAPYQAGPEDEEFKGDQSHRPRMTFVTVRMDQIYMQDFIDRDFLTKPIPENIRYSRNRAIVYLFMQILFSFAALALYVQRRSRPILVMIIFSLILSLSGLYGVIRVKTTFHFMHAFFCTSVLGAFYIYLMIDTFLTSDSRTNSQTAAKNEQMSDTWVLFMMSLPFFGIFLVGCHSMYLLNMIYDELAARKKDDKTVQLRENLISNSQNVNALPINNGGPQHNRLEPKIPNVYEAYRNEKKHPNEIQILQIPENLEAERCIICMDNTKDTIFYPCGHECVCNPCGKAFMGQALSKMCPICRNRVNGVTKVYR
eukprot:403376593